MKMPFIYTVLSLLFAGFLFFSNSAGPGEVQQQDRTGSPLSSAGCGQVGCHAAGAFAPTIKAELFDGNDLVTTYEPGKKYRFRITITPTTGRPAAYGFQAVALTGAANANAGAWAMRNDSLQVTTVNGRSYAEHSRRNLDGIFEIEWTAPAAGTGDARFHAAGIAANGAGGETGDGAAVLQQPLVITELTSNSTAEELTGVELSVFPNPASQFLQVKIGSLVSERLQLRILNLNGQLLQQRMIQLAPGENLENMDISRLTPGAYVVLLSDGRKTASRKIVVR